MGFETLIHPILQSAQELIASVREETGQAPTKAGLGLGILSSLGLRRSARLPVLAALHAELQCPILLLTDRTDRALTLVDEMALLADKALRLFFPEPNPLFYENASWGETTRRDRLIVLTNLASYHIPGAPLPATPPIIIAPARAVMARTLPRREFLKAIRILKPSQTIPPEELARILINFGYEHSSTVIVPGQFARRGGILDLWPPAEASPARLDFFGDEIEGVRHFDPTTQRSTNSLQQLFLSPAREFLLSHNSHSNSLLSTLVSPPSEFHIPLLHPWPAGLIDYLPRQALILVDNWEDFQNTIQEIEEQSMGLRAEYEKDGTLPLDFPLPYLPWTEIQDTLSTHRTLELGPSTAPENSELAQLFTSSPRFGGRLKPLLEHLFQRASAGDRVIVVSRQSSRLLELWSEAKPSTLPPSPDPSSPNPLFLEGSLSEGWILTPPAGPVLHLLSDGEIFGWRRPEPRQRLRAIAEAPEAAYADLQVGDWVVHIDHGIGRFLGLVNRAVDGVEREYLAVEYAEGDQLFVPVHQADRLTRYVGPDSRLPASNRLGGVEWRNVKARAREAVIEVAEDLLNLYAQRQVVAGNAFSQDSAWQHELEASFPYVETEDQLRVIGEVKRDMESPRPMDRLICGDVGYGKTEVALRATFKAVMDGKQVAMLVPTTVLAQQHFYTFRERLAAFPVEVEMLSRFRTPQQQREILFRLAMGNVDIIIGTHRLLQEDVEFKDLGLLIIDEEQRFGVTHKEYLKKMRSEVDVLTLTATPIPRTLYMALTGVRDISTINTPPEERLPIITHVGPFSQRLVRQAILRELERGGQIFFVHNRVQTITAMRSHLERLVPGARLAIAHGQMDENQLSERMQQFTNGEIDVLLTTSIIESGLDIPNANTLIVDRADTFGLSQLYQLRGRVGRGAQRAYAYFFKHRRKIPTLEGRQRLETIAENAQLGAGFNIAMRDLEIRGAGDILGSRQHGHIAAVGFHLYTRLLGEAVARLRVNRGLPPDSQAPVLDSHRPLVSVDLPLHISIPPDYVSDKNMRLHLYRRIADLRTTSEIDPLIEEFKDRFGIPPAPVRNLLFQLKIKLLAENANVASINVESDQIVVRFQDGSLPSDLPDLGANVRRGKTALWLPYSAKPEWPDHLVSLLHILQDLGRPE
ncbi:MAG: transcription-repair coupling factor [Chloroflexi bacterium RBG_19FT_COMBO_55_16]|nr:MAG: transcription-repair coupling factor [Chloroflexi bacterium RBG_19FT_COMBO_55_16]